jgi:putative transcriptional regulator
VFPENKLSPSAGRVLISEPFMKDPYFRRSVGIIAEHNSKGTVAFMLNKSLGIHIHEAMSDFPALPIPLYFGGPVQKDQLYYIHRLGALIPDSYEIMPGIWWQGKLDTMIELLHENIATAENVRFMAGYAGWEKNQLRRELDERSWFISEQEVDWIFNTAPDMMWKQALKNMGQDFSVVAEYPEDFSAN